MRIFIIGLFFEIILSSSPYLSLQNTESYSIIEYELLLKNNSTNIFILNQPYDVHQVDTLLLSNSRFKRIFNEDNYWEKTSSEKINIRFSPSLNHYQNEDNNKSHIGLNLDGVIRISDIFFVNEIELDEKFKSDIDFHGDTGEWLMGYFNSSYVKYKNNALELFAGRVSRNFGTLNDFGLILSDNPYAFDHYGFSAVGSKMKYSFYTTRLNDIDDAIDIQGVTIPIDSIASAHRFWAIQRLDYKINKRFQIALSEATIYGGPYQQFVASYLSPTHFFYAAQRNQRVQLNGFWQINMFYQPVSGIGLYLDLFADDIIVNNEPDIDDRSIYPDRLGILIKASYAKTNKILMSLRYVRIWNETYTSFRTFENYTYFNKGIGYPNNSYESIKYNQTFLNYLPTFIGLYIEIWRNGNRNLISAFQGELNPFPVTPVIQGITFNINASTLYKRMKYKVQMKMIHMPKDWNIDMEKENFKELQFALGVKISYNFNKL